MKLTKITLAIAFAAITFASCNETKETAAVEENATTEIVAESTPAAAVDTKQFVGSWTQPIPGNEKEVQGFELKEDGTAVSVNMATLVTSKWWVEGDKLFLVEESIGNGSSSIDTTGYTFELLDGKTLNLVNGEFKQVYNKQ